MTERKKIWKGIDFQQFEGTSHMKIFLLLYLFEIIFISTLFLSIKIRPIYALSLSNGQRNNNGCKQTIPT
jgi:hypothetical protein